MSEHRFAVPTLAEALRIVVIVVVSRYAVPEPAGTSARTKAPS